MSVALRSVRFHFLDPRDARRILGIWAAWSGAILLLGELAMVLPVASSNPWTAAYRAPPLARWDAVWYRSIAIEGYHLAGPAGDANVGWYPLYPWMLRLAAAGLHLPVLWVGIGLSILLLLPALLFCGDLFAEWGGRDAALAGTATLLLFPTSFYLASVYSESLFLLVAAAAIWGARRGRWAIAGIAGFAASLTRLNGVLIALPIAWQALRPVSRGPSRLHGLIASVVALAGAAVFPLLLWRRFGDPLLYLQNRVQGSSVRPQPAWSLAAKIGREIHSRILDPGRMDNLSYASQLLCALLFAVLTILLLRRRLTGEALYTGGTLLLLFHSGTIDGLDRYVLALFPCFFILAEFLKRHAVAAFAYAVAGVGVGTVFLHRFVHWIMVS